MWVVSHVARPGGASAATTSLRGFFFISENKISMSFKIERFSVKRIRVILAELCKSVVDSARVLKLTVVFAAVCIGSVKGK